jgi:hypothetical protein
MDMEDFAKINKEPCGWNGANRPFVNLSSPLNFQRQLQKIIGLN